jgi:hypothetical protein
MATVWRNRPLNFELELNNAMSFSSRTLSGYEERHLSSVLPNIVGLGGLVLYMQSKGAGGTVFWRHVFLESKERISERRVEVPFSQHIDVDEMYID